MLIQCEYLSEWQEHVDEVTTLKYNQWLHTAPDRDFVTWKRQIESTLNIGKIPFTAIAIDNTTLLGFVSVVQGIMNDMFPGAIWMITLYVRQQFRKRGIANQLMQFCESEVRKLGSSRLHLWTEGKLTEYYRSRDWQYLEDIIDGGMERQILYKDI